MPVGEAKISLDKTGIISAHENCDLKLSPEIPSLLRFPRTLHNSADHGPPRCKNRLLV
jgi:hypothetical protein